MLDINVTAEVQIILFKGEIDMFSQVSIFLQMSCCEVHVFITCAARSNNIEAGLFGDCQIPGAERVCQQFINIEIGCRTAAIPVLNFT